MELKEFIITLEKMNFSLSVKEGKLILKGDKKKLSTEEIEAIKSNKLIIDYIKSHKEQLIDYLSLYPDLSAKANVKNIVSVYRLSGLQQGMLFHGLYNEDSGSYIEQISCDLLNVNREILLKSWAEVIRRHTALRSAFYYDSFSVPVQCVHNEVILPVEDLDYRGMDEAVQKNKLKEYEASDRLKSFDFKTPPLMRIGLIRLDDKRYHMVWTSHHILYDGWSTPVLMGELLSTYEYLISGEPVPIVAEDKYEDYIRYLEHQDQDAQEQYWRNYLKDTNTGTLLPFINATADRTNGFGKHRLRTTTIDEINTARIQDYTKSNHITVNTLVQGVWAWLLAYYTNSNEAIYGVVVSGRPDDLLEIEQRVGMYINTLPLKTTISENQNIVNWLQSLQEEQIASRQYQYTALQDIQQWSKVKKDLFDSLLVFENYPVSKLLTSKAWSLKVENIQIKEQTNYPLTLMIINSKTLSIGFNYNSDLLEETYVTDIQKQFEHVLLQVVEGKVGLLKDIRPLTSAQEHHLVTEFNTVSASYPKDKSIVTLFEEQVENTSTAIAVIFENERLSYDELNKQSNQLAHYLIRKGVQSETLVPICLERGLGMIIGILAILKAGGVYVPVDSDYPTKRINYILEDTGAILVVTNKANSGKLMEHITCISLDEELELIRKESTANPEVIIKPEQLAYIIYTSGSTGKPKGVLIQHNNVVQLLKASPALYDFTAQDVWTMFHSFCFDFSVWEMYGALLFGGKLVIVPKSATQDFGLFSDLLIREQVTVLNQTPSAFYNLQEEYLEREIKETSIRYVIFGGEALNPAKLQFWYQQYNSCRLINMYGITETTVHVTYQELKPFHLQSSRNLIGKPLPTLTAYILNSSRQFVPVGVTGEIYVGGAGVARGYLNRAELTAEKFIKDPYSEDENARLYKSGDLARWLPDGNIEYQGRTDDQVKIRGYRIELGEIESLLTQSKMVRQGVVLAIEDNNNSKKLVGYVIPNEKFDKLAVEAYLQNKLPEYMIPALWVIIDSIPLTSNGKVNRKALLDMGYNKLSVHEYLAPRNEIEQGLSIIWQELLNIERVGINDNFFELGGHSLSVMRLVSAVRRQMKKELTIREVFTNSTIALLSAHFQKELKNTPVPSITAVVNPAQIPLSFSQERLWFIDRLEGSVQYHIPTVLRLTGKLDRDALAFALKKVVDRHEILRTVYREKDGKAFQHVIEKGSWDLSFIDYQSKNIGNEKLGIYIAQLINQPFDLSKDNMLRAHLLILNQEEYTLILTLHHIASDGWSSSIMVEELIALYTSYIEKREAKLPALPIQYADYAIWQRTNMQGEVLANKLAYWQEKLAGLSPLQLPTDFVRPAIQSNKGAIVNFEISKELSGHLNKLSLEQGATLFMTVLAAFKVLLYHYSGQEDICVGTPIAGRQQHELENLIGFFINTLAIRSQVNGNLSFKELLGMIKNTMLEAYEHQDAPFEKVVEVVVKERDRSRSPLFQVMFVLQNTPDIPEFNFAELKLIVEDQIHSTSMFDLSVFITETNDGLYGNIAYNTELYNSETINQLADHYQMLLKTIVVNPEEKIRELQLLNIKEVNNLLYGFNKTKSINNTDKNVIDLFEEQAANSPDSVAIVFGKKQITYQQLNNRANQLARYLKKKGVGTETLVPVFLERSIEIIVGMLGILKAGGAYVPIDTDYPWDRVSYILEDTQAKIILSSIAYREKLNGHPEIEIIELDNDQEAIISQPIENLRENLSLDHLVYVIYTSGSTGKPKGVMIEHKGLTNLVNWHNQEYQVSKNSSATSMAGVGFDAFGWEVWPYLSVGAMVYMINDNQRSNVPELITLINNHQISHSFITTALFPEFYYNIYNKDSSLKYLLTGGDRLSSLDIQDVKFEIVNNYGPTESSVVSTSYNLSSRDKEKMPLIGKPISNTQIYILNNNRRLVPIGVIGEIYIGGDSLARGYLNLPELTTEKFISDPFSDEIGARLYRTGDIGRWLPDGNIEYQGRIDDQVKIRGYRIELGEIESVIAQSGMVNQAAVLVKAENNNNKRLVGYVVPTNINSFNKEELTRYLKTQLPEYMVPGLWIELESLPLTPNGKINRNELPDPGINWFVSKYVAPRNETQVKLAEIWQELLGIKRVGINDNFFELGGHSLLVMRLASHIELNLLVSIPIHILFQFTTINDLSKYIEIKTKPDYEEESNASFKFLDV